MNYRKLSIITLLFASLLIVYFMWPDEKKTIRNLIEEGTEAVEKGSVNETMSFVSLTYRDDYGLSYLALKKQLESFLQRFSDIEIEYEITDIVVEENTIEVKLIVRVVGTLSDGRRGYVYGDIDNPLESSLFYEQQRMKWLITKITFQDL